MTLAAAIPAWAKELGIRTVCEGVETQEQFDFLKEAGCNLAQGSLFSPPVPLDELYKKWHLIYRQKKTASHRASGFSLSIFTCQLSQQELQSRLRK
ncbi:hypothetical protein BTH95_05745 [Lactobacillus delbrueckii subsp. bulgaricus]|nr:hypothetical protein [Lactobacillus delbrueckii subsp. bulgaricus]MBT8816350.1 hypothetical protein [Lactobacillus delbrueckii subsp. bulgaricus]MBT8841570.1 hypothetical protein [Lactobacillus delbrueckii subsp. bulgaricus]MBT8862185.1 hypothetical protein [Lactobacillus delbrueckii subsp. bulgaricus]MBT8863784.1 hypothetical protein [Lactobacillus delbrueckii subsp. bulgaricus]